MESMIRMGVDGIVSDFPDRTTEVVQRLRHEPIVPRQRFSYHAFSRYYPSLLWRWREAAYEAWKETRRFLGLTKLSRSLIVDYVMMLIWGWYYRPNGIEDIEVDLENTLEDTTTSIFNELHPILQTIQEVCVPIYPALSLSCRGMPLNLKCLSLG